MKYRKSEVYDLVNLEWQRLDTARSSCNISYLNTNRNSANISHALFYSRLFIALKSLIAFTCWT